jgi:hypothetical protein
MTWWGSFAPQVSQFGFYLDKVMLLGSDHRSGAAQPTPGNGLRCRKSVHVHQSTAHKRSSASKAGLAVNRNGTRFIRANRQETLDDIPVRTCTVRKVQIVVTKSRLAKNTRVIASPVQTYHSSDAKLLKEANKVLGSTAHADVCCFRAARRTRERQQLTRNNPVQVAVVYLLPKLIWFDIERIWCEEVAHIGRPMPSADAVKDAQRERGFRTSRCIAKENQRAFETLEFCIGLFGEISKAKNPIGAHQGCCVRQRL